MRKHAKRIFIMLLTLVMIVGLNPVVAQAADEYVYHYPAADDYPYYQMSMYAYQIEPSADEKFPTGVFRLKDTQNGDQVSYAYCANSDQYDECDSYYKIVPLSELETTRNQEEKLRAIINHSYPFLTEEEMIEAMTVDGVSLHYDTVPYYEMVLITAVQQTIYSYTNPDTVIQVPVAGVVQNTDYEFYKTLIYNFREDYNDTAANKEYYNISADVSAVINWLKNLPGESAPVQPSVSFQASVALDNGTYILTLSDFAEALKEANSLTATVSVGNTVVLEDQPITLNEDGESQIELPDSVQPLPGDTLSVTVSGTQIYEDAVAYESRVEDKSQPFIGRQTLSRELSYTASGISIPKAITITPADITIYMGGEDGYSVVVGGDNTVTDTTSLPRPLFYVEAPAGVEPTDLTFSSTDSVPGNPEANKQWTITAAGEDREGVALYYLNKVHEAQDEVRVQYSIGDQIFVSDQFNPSEIKDLFEDYTISLYTGAVNTKTVTARAQGTSETYSVITETGTLRVRAVENGDYTPENNPVYHVQKEEPQNRLPSNTAAVVAPETTKYTLNHTTVEVQPSGAGLLFDDIYDKDNGENIRETALITQTDEQLGPVKEGWTRYYQAKYLDLVDTDNGNAWIKTVDQPVTVYWAYPEGSDENDNFTLLHFENLHRDDADGADSGYNTEDIYDTTPSVVTINKTEAGISFSVPSGRFSPFVLVWEVADDTPTPPPSGEDERVGSLTVSKTVTGGGDQTRDFTFTITLTNDGSQLGTRFSYFGSKSGTVKSGETFTLRHGQSITITGIPAGSKYSVTEVQEDGYTLSADDATGTIPNGGRATAAFINALDQTPPDDDDKDPNIPDDDKDPNIPDDDDKDPNIPDDDDKDPNIPDDDGEDPGIPDDDGEAPGIPDGGKDPDSPQTGDNSMTGLWMLLSALSLGGLFLSWKGRWFYQGKRTRK